MLIKKLHEAGSLDCPKWLPDSVAYLTITGSMAYAVNDENSDTDMVGFCMPPVETVFPHLAGVIKGFGEQGEQFNNWQAHKAKTQDGAEYDLTVYSLVKYFDLCMAMNPNMVDTLFTADNLVVHRSKVSDMVRANRKHFLHKGAWHKFKGYSFAQMKRFLGTGVDQKMTMMTKFMADHQIAAVDLSKLEAETDFRLKESSVPMETGLSHLTNNDLAAYQKMATELTSRQIKTLEVGIDTKAGYHIVRLMLEVEQILTEGDLDLQRNKEVLKSIRRGEWPLERLKAYFEEKERSLEQVFLDSKLPYGPDEKALRTLLLQCMEEHYGDLSAVVQKNTSMDDVLADLRRVVEKYGG
jgi:predicted nucleotidyltransferase